MYRILYNGELMHDPSLNDDRFVVFEPTLKEEANMAASLTFVIYPTNARYNDLTKMIPGTVEAYDDNDLIFRGRVISDDQGWLNQKTVTCESDVAYLNDTIVRPYSYNGTVANYLRQLITSHNSQVAANKQFTVRNVTVTDPNNNIVRSSTQYPTTWAEIKEKLIDNLGGYLVTEYTGGVMYIDYLADITTTAYQTIELSKNLLSFSREIKGEDYITALIPLGATVENSEERVTIKSVNSGNDYIVSPAASTYGLIFGTEVWDDVTVPANLLTKAQARLAERARGETTIQLSALDLHLLDDNVHSLRFLSYVNCIDDEHDFSGRFLITQKTTDMTNPGNSTITFGKTFGGLTGYTSKTKGDVENIVRDYVKNEKIFEVNESISALSSELTQTASEIRAEVSEVQTDVGDLETRMTSAEAAIVVNANNISTKVSQTDYNGSTIASLINQSASTVTIQAQHIKLEGAITANQTFSINSSGFMTVTGGHIGGWDIGTTVLQKFSAQPTTSGDQYNVFMQAPETPSVGDSPTRAFGVQKRTFTDGTAGSWSNVFYVNYKGKLYAKDAEITGTISGSTITGSTISGTTINGGTINGTAITGEAISITAKGDITNGTTLQNKYDLAIVTQNETAGRLTYKNILLRGRILSSSDGVTNEGSLTVSPNGISAIGDQFNIGKASGDAIDNYASFGFSGAIQFYKTLKSTSGAEFMGDVTLNPGGITATRTISSGGSICSGGKASVWDSNEGGIMSASGLISLRASSSVTPGLYVTAYGSTTTTYDAGFYYNATETRWQANKQIYATSLLTSGNVTAQRSDTSTPSIIAKNSVGEIALHVAASGNRGVRDNTNSEWLVYKNASTGQREPYATTSNSGFMSPADKTKLNALGTLKGTTTGSGGTVTVPGTSTWTKYGTALTFDEAGLWLVIVNATFDSNSTGRRGLSIDQVTGTWAAYTPEAGTQIHTDVRPASATSYVRVVGLVSVAANDMYAINLWSSAGSSTSLTATVRYTCVRLRNN